MLEGLTNRQRGAILVFLSGFMLVLDIVLVRGAELFYRGLLPFAGFVLPLGLYMLVTERGGEDFQSGKTPPETVRMLLSVMVMCALFGLIGNRLIAGRPW